MSAKKPCKAWKTKAQDVSSMTSNSNNEPTFLDMNDLCDDSLEALIQHYLKLKHRMPDNISVRERLLELEREQFNRELKADAESKANNREREASTIEGVIRQNTENPL
jgi:hypothetical protein